MNQPQNQPLPYLSDTADAAHHADNQRRFIALEDALAVNTELTAKLASDTAELVDMWKDASVVFCWFRKIGAALMWLSKVVVAVGAVYGAIRYWGQKP